MADQPKRIQRQRTKGWRMPEGAVYVGRGTLWGNPFKVALPEWTPAAVTALFCEAVNEARRGGMAPDWVFGRWMNHDESELSFSDWLQPLRGKTLACLCRLDQPCHADVLLELANPDA